MEPLPARLGNLVWGPAPRRVCSAMSPQVCDVSGVDKRA